ncbi:MAG: putative lipid II flippase FtsW [Ruminococcus sp.]|jgi:cell division protein FtsW|nr:putative lipid II flippase FtsW [Ruminococcus sp.]
MENIGHINAANKKPVPKYKNPVPKPRLRKGPVDVPFVIILFVLLVMGLIMMFSAGYAWAIEENHPGDYYFQRQLRFALLGLAAAFAASHFDYHNFMKKWVVIGIFATSILLLILCLVGPFVSPHNKSYRWVQIGPIPEFQPSEVAKFAVIVVFAVLFVKFQKKLDKFIFGIIPFLAILGIVAALLMQERHLSATIIICIIGVIMMFVGGSKLKHLIPLGIAGLAGLGGFLAYSYLSDKDELYFGDRIAAWLDPFAPEFANDLTWQTRQSLIAIGSGGWFGLGLGNSRQKFLYLPESKNDFVFAIVCEELGFFGALIVVLIFLLFIIRGFHIANHAPDKLGMLLAVGLTAQIGVQALLNIAVVTNTIPNTGISLPFFSYGGTALVMQLAQMGVLLNISRQSIIDT